MLLSRNYRNQHGQWVPMQSNMTEGTKLFENAVDRVIEKEANYDGNQLRRLQFFGFKMTCNICTTVANYDLRKHIQNSCRINKLQILFESILWKFSSFIKEHADSRSP